MQESVDSQAVQEGRGSAPSLKVPRKHLVYASALLDEQGNCITSSNSILPSGNISGCGRCERGVHRHADVNEISP